MQIMNEISSEVAQSKIKDIFQKYGCAAEHTYSCYANTICHADPNARPFVFVSDDGVAVLSAYEPKHNEYRLFTEILAPQEKKADVLKQFLDHVFSQENKPAKVWLELESDTRRDVLKSLKNSPYKCNDINYTLIWPLFEMDEWNGDKMEGGEWKDMRYYWNKFFREHKVEFVTADKVSKDDLKNLVYEWKKNRTTKDIAYTDFYIKAIESGFSGFDVTRIMVVDGKIAAMTAGFETRPGYYYSSIGLYDVLIPRCNDIANMDDLINLKNLGYKTVDFGGMEKSKLDFKKKFRPTRYYKTHVFSIVYNDDSKENESDLVPALQATSSSAGSDPYPVIKTKPSEWEGIKNGILDVENDAFEESIRYEEDDFDTFQNNNGANYVAKDGNKIIGYLMSCPMENDGYYRDDPHFGLHDTTHLESTAVLSSYRGKGVGQKLFLRWLDDAVKKGFKRAVMDATSESMIGLGLKHGFVKVKFDPDWEGRTAWFMEKIL